MCGRVLMLARQRKECSARTGSVLGQVAASHLGTDEQFENVSWEPLTCAIRSSVRLGHLVHFACVGEGQAGRVLALR